MLYLCYLCRFKPLRDHLRGFLIAAWAGDKIAEFSFPEISFHFPLRPWFFFVSPAYAGKSHSYLNSTFLNLGSPPRMRGKGAPFRAGALPLRITPAYAGKSQCNSSCTAGKWDHPRVCGEKPRQDSVGALEGRITPACAGKSLSGFLELVTGVGSPPHVRGKVGRTLYLVAGERITPAYAGKSFL